MNLVGNFKDGSPGVSNRGFGRDIPKGAKIFRRTQDGTKGGGYTALVGEIFWSGVLEMSHLVTESSKEKELANKERVGRSPFRCFTESPPHSPQKVQASVANDTIAAVVSGGGRSNEIFIPIS